MAAAVTPLLTLDQAAAALTISRRSLERLIRAGRVRTVRPSPGRVAVEQREVEAYLAALRRVA